MALHDIIITTKHKRYYSLILPNKPNFIFHTIHFHSIQIHFLIYTVTISQSAYSITLIDCYVMFLICFLSYLRFSHLLLVHLISFSPFQTQRVISLSVYRKSITRTDEGKAERFSGINVSLKWEGKMVLSVMGLDLLIDGLIHSHCVWMSMMLSSLFCLTP